MRELLVGVLVDVSGSMASAIENRSGESSTRLEAFRDALEQLARKSAGAIDAAEESGGAVELRLFAYGFGFGNILSSLLGRQGSPVRDLLSMPGQGETLVNARQLSADWPRYKANVERLIPEMFGNTPMGAAFDQALERFARHQLSPGGQKLLLIVSDGDPTDRPKEAILAQADALKAQGILVISCYVTSADIAEPRRLYATAPEDWPTGAHLMHVCASPIPAGSPFESYLRELRWAVDADARLFTQVNQSAMLNEFVNIVLSPIEDRHSPHHAEPAIERLALELQAPAKPRAAESASRVTSSTPSLVLFVHGLGGDARGTWGQFPDLLANDPDFKSRLTIGFYEFPTSLFRLPFASKAPRIQDLAAGLRTQIEHRYGQHRHIALVCHSLGGLIARRYLIDEHKGGRRSPVSGLVLFAVPNNGAGLASVAQHLSWRNAQLRQLCADSDLIDSLNEDWFILKLHEQLRVRCVVGGVDRVVDVQSARSYWGNPHVDTVIDRGHIDIVKPALEGDLSYLVVRNFLLGDVGPKQEVAAVSETMGRM